MTLAEFVERMNADLRNEWTHLQFYLYHAGAVTGLHAEEYREFLHEAAKGELEHVLQFTHRLFGLNYEMPTSDGHSFPKYTNISDILAHAIQLETAVADNYAKRINELDALAGAHPTVAAYLTIFYENQLEDSYEDCEKMRRIMGDL
jgi:bacterioferritin (cytochrome b1)